MAVGKLKYLEQLRIQNSQEFPLPLLTNLLKQRPQGLNSLLLCNVNFSSPQTFQWQFLDTIAKKIGVEPSLDNSDDLKEFISSIEKLPKIRKIFFQPNNNNNNTNSIAKELVKLPIIGLEVIIGETAYHDHYHQIGTRSPFQPWELVDGIHPTKQGVKVTTVEGNIDLAIEALKGNAKLEKLWVSDQIPKAFFQALAGGSSSNCGKFLMELCLEMKPSWGVDSLKNIAQVLPNLPVLRTLILMDSNSSISHWHQLWDTVDQDFVDGIKENYSIRELLIRTTELLPWLVYSQKLRFYLRLNEANFRIGSRKEIMMASNSFLLSKNQWGDLISAILAEQHAEPFFFLSNPPTLSEILARHSWQDNLYYYQSKLHYYEEVYAQSLGIVKDANSIPQQKWIELFSTLSTQDDLSGLYHYFHLYTQNNNHGTKSNSKLMRKRKQEDHDGGEHNGSRKRQRQNDGNGDREDDGVDASTAAWWPFWPFKMIPRITSV